ncbi:MAG TPA: response regulator [Nitrosospira sp.]|nr:response regulator [Nitrosospira sp.]
MSIFKHILIVDDSPRDTELAVNALENYQLTNKITCLRDGEEALDYLYRRGEFAGRTDTQPAVVLLDLKMPKVDGIEVLRQIKDDPILKVIPVVVMTSSREEQDILKSYELGVNAYVVKPVKFQEFIEAVKQLGMFWAILNEPPSDNSIGEGLK